MIAEKENDEISSPSSLVAFEEEEISSSRRPTLVRHHTVALGSAAVIPHAAGIQPTALYPVTTADHVGSGLTVAAQQADSRRGKIFLEAPDLTSSATNTVDTVAPTL